MANEPDKGLSRLQLLQTGLAATAVTLIAGGAEFAFPPQAQFTEQDWAEIAFRTHAGMNQAAFKEIATRWLATQQERSADSLPPLWSAGQSCFTKSNHLA
jgi:hypothetical protein